MALTFLPDDAAAFSKVAAVPFDRPVPPDLMIELDLDEIARAVEQFEAAPPGLAAHRRRLSGLGARLTALADELRKVSAA